MSCPRAQLIGLRGQARPVSLLGSLLGGSRSCRRCSFRNGPVSAARLADQCPHRPLTTCRPCGKTVAAYAAAVPATHRLQLSSCPLQRSEWGRAAPAALQQGRLRQCWTQAVIETDSLVPLGLDFLTFLAATVLVIPLFKSVKASPILGFLFSGLLLGQLGYAALINILTAESAEPWR